jgi:hypothetical protein
MKSLAHIFRDLVHHNGHAEKSSGADDGKQAHYLPISDQAHNQQAPPQPAVTSQDVLNHLGPLADDYHLPRKLVYAVALAESDFDVTKVHKNIAHDKQGRPIL